MEITKHRVNSIFHNFFRPIHSYPWFRIIFIFHSFQFSSLLEHRMEYQLEWTGIEIKHGLGSLVPSVTHQTHQHPTHPLFARIFPSITFTSRSNIIELSPAHLPFCFLHIISGIRGGVSICPGQTETMIRECLPRVHGSLKNSVDPSDAITAAMSTRRLFADY